jgi:hypothetical protein
MDWIEAHHFVVGFFADFLTFLGAILLARDAFLRLKELKKARISRSFDDLNPGLNLTDEEFQAAVVAMRWTITGFSLLIAGFACQMLLRVAERHPS